MMKRLLIIFLIMLPMLAFLPATNVLAAFDPLDEVCQGVPTTDDPSTLSDNETSSVCAEKDQVDNPLSGTGGLLLRAASFMSLITGMASIIIIVYGSIKYVTSGGKSESVDSAKNTILYAFVGLVVSLMARGIIVFVINKIT